MPVLSSLEGGRITTVAPTTTSTALSSIATGLTPGEHGLIGYRMVVGGEILNVLRWAVNGDDRRRVYPPADVQRFPAFMGKAVPVVSPIELTGTAFSEAHLRGSVPVGWRAASSMPVEIRRLLQAGERFVYAYYGSIDKIAHERGFGDYYEAELRAADRLVGDVLEALPDRAALLVTADHGQVEVGDRMVKPSAEPAVAVCDAVRRGPVPVVPRQARRGRRPAGGGVGGVRRHGLGDVPRAADRRRVVRADRATRCRAATR